MFKNLLKEHDERLSSKWRVKDCSIQRQHLATFSMSNSIQAVFRSVARHCIWLFKKMVNDLLLKYTIKWMGKLQGHLRSLNELASLLDFKICYWKGTSGLGKLLGHVRSLKDPAFLLCFFLASLSRDRMKRLGFPSRMIPYLLCSMQERFLLCTQNLPDREWVCMIDRGCD